MTKQIDGLMALADSYADGPHTEGYYGHRRQALRTALEAALKPEEPVGEVAGYFEKGFDTTKTLYGKIWNQDLPMGAKLYTAPPSQNPPPRLTDGAVANLLCEYSVYTRQGQEQFARAIESAVRKQFLGRDE